MRSMANLNIICLLTISVITAISPNEFNDDQLDGILRSMVKQELKRLEATGWNSEDPLLNNVINKATELVENGPKIVWYEDDHILQNVIVNLQNYLAFLKDEGFDPNASIADNVKTLSTIIVNRDKSMNNNQRLASKLEQLMLNGFSNFQSPGFDLHKSLIENLSQLLVKSISSNAYKTDLPIFQSFNLAHAYQWISLHNQQNMDPTAETVSQIVLSSLISIYFPGYSPGLTLDQIVSNFLSI